MKYAYLIIANRNHKQLQKLLTALDDSRNDIYLMVDKKAKNFPRNFHVNYSTLNYVKPINIYWGSYSQIRAELNLFKAAAPDHYTYYHLLSGLDLPLVNQDKIHDFFDNNLYHEFIAYGSSNNLIKLPNRVKHHLFRKHYRTHNHFMNLYRRLENNIINLETCPIPKNKLDYASNWVSLDDDFVQYIVAHEDQIYQMYKYGRLVDEVFIPTLLNYVPNFKKRVYSIKRVHTYPTNELQGNMRYIDWWDGGPYTWRLKDYRTLIRAKNMGHLFSRKFDSRIDNEIINKIYYNIMM